MTIPSATSASPKFCGAWLDAAIIFASRAFENTWKIVKPKPISESAVRMIDISVRSALMRVRWNDMPVRREGQLDRDAVGVVEIDPRSDVRNAVRACVGHGHVHANSRDGRVPVGPQSAPRGADLEIVRVVVGVPAPSRSRRRARASARSGNGSRCRASSRMSRRRNSSARPSRDRRRRMRAASSAASLSSEAPFRACRRSDSGTGRRQCRAGRSTATDRTARRRAPRASRRARRSSSARQTEIAEPVRTVRPERVVAADAGCIERRDGLAQRAFAGLSVLSRVSYSPTTRDPTRATRIRSA